LDRSVWVIVAAAGQGLRAIGPGVVPFGLAVEIPKQFRRLGDSTVIETVVSQFLRLDEVAGIVVALPPSGVPREAGLTAADIEASGSAGVPVICVTGGSTRQDSVRNALASVPRDARWVAVHDAARPFFSQDLFRRVLEACVAHGAAVPGLPPSDTIKWVERPSCDASTSPSCQEELRVHATLDRQVLSAVQTPQIFERDILASAYSRAIDEGFSGTDDSQLVERLGVKVAVVPGESGNIKLTYPEDFERLAGSREPDCCSGTCHEPTRAGRERVTVTGLGFDVHPFAEGRRCVIGGVTIPHSRGLAGHSDADVLTHAIMDALLGAMAAADIGEWFPEIPEYKDARSVDLLRSMWQRLCDGATIVHLDTVIVAQAPRIAPYAGAMKAAIAEALGIRPDQVSIKATTTERMGFTGREEGIAAFCSATVSRYVRAGSGGSAAAK
jgi:2-C-methyl-D-erythritol 4-phosphate cytidylyltransferase/2-C-methyl-D-erythritol 2,4-cyclodiphosphate synthase